MNRCKGKIALVTGAGRGIGAGIAKEFAEQGAFVFVSDLDESTAKSTAAEIISSGGAALGFGLDVTSGDDWARVTDLVAKEKGRLDILVNNAGIETIATIADITYEQWRRTQDINVDGVFRGIKSCLDLLKVSGADTPSGASIINLSSIAGLVGVTDQVAYNTSKGAVRIMTKAMAIEFAAHGYNIRVNSIHPGVIGTAMMDEVYETWQKNNTVGTQNMDEVKEIVVNMHPLKRIGSPKDIAMGAVYLGSDESGFVTGAELVIDGGWVAQ
ncbi:glucose 1-dehydrogenase [Kordiimonas pumila]|uniref:Glucose 1-dehydrogenase n=1 Tax=Kordiimonas pumila TaxID=2161677 RepID=A0ABV7D9L5_9PROT|nr:glucose 1-dehydrogenase [Kordiimonas pumila]